MTMKKIEKYTEKFLASNKWPALSDSHSWESASVVQLHPEYDFWVVFWDSKDAAFNPTYKYLLFDLEYLKTVPVFNGDATLGISVTSDLDIALAITGWCSLRPGDVESDFFEWYSKRQLAWRDERAEELGDLVAYLKAYGEDE